ncbi:MAG: hypothetical protein HXX10_23615 [Rhodoplanes sp.]|uniref:hypothetical protein n=1 Tax=Rhodoplanes sp. TaxID=1968906 RepID=UPI0017E23322|nr:hypothetical protein [Rhodoplanes sp.]NVO17025.1 hypothetical protein [Rhodoplanes sp.]
MAARITHRAARRINRPQGVGQPRAGRPAGEIARNISDLSRGAGETGAGKARLLSSARSLASESNRLELEVEKFLQTVRAA